MRSAPGARWLAGIASISAALAVFACAKPAIDNGDDIALPVRQPIDDGGDADADVAPSEPIDAPPQDAGPDANVLAQNAALCGAADLALCFTFENDAVDHSPNALPATVSDVTFGPGQLGEAAVFSASSALRFAPAAALEVTTATIEAWVDVAPGPPGDGVVFDDDDRMSLTILADGSVQCIPNASLPTTQITFGRWTHVACVFDGTAVHVYVDGAEVQTGIAGAIGSSPTSTAAIGGNAPSGMPFVGAIDSFRVFKVARTAAEIAAAAGK